ncbi:MAG TPA: alpha/beta hydrolase [Spirochaetota bacterium]|nr:alpha/beta hydrolase [Spirochaetota bacterium]HPJ34541.1 alpha/beta hydrolase [Spirochaetota bacterium]
MLPFKNKENRLNYNHTGTENVFNNLLLIHDNGQSSKIFDSELKFYSSYFYTVTVDLTGHGKSAKGIDTYDNYWVMNAAAALAVCEKNKMKKVSIIGTGGGGIVALNMALLNPGLVKAVIAESLPGTDPDENYIASLISYREKIYGSDMKAKYQQMNGSKWDKILTADTEMQIDFAERGGKFFHRDLSEITCPVLLTGCAGYDLLPDIEDRMKHTAEFLKKPHLHMFSTGKYPLFLSRNDEFRTVSLNFLMD